MDAPSDPAGDPTGFHAARLLDKYGAPDQVLEAPIETAAGAPALRAGYADAARKYAVHSPAAAWLSAARYLDAADPDPATGAALKRALEEHRLAGEWDRLEMTADCARKLEKAAAAPTRYALPGRYPIDTPDRVAAAARYFEKYASDFSHADRAAYARAVAGELTPALEARLGPDLVRTIEAEAGLGRLAPDWRRAVATRAKLAAAAGSPGAAAAIEKVAAGPPGDPLELVQVLRDLDKVAEWVLPDPIAEVIGATPAPARAKLAGAVRAPSGRWYPAAALDAVPDAVVGELFTGCPVASRAKKAALLADPATGPEFEHVLADHGGFWVEQEAPGVDWAALARAP